jgi:hypothetical protein
MLQPPGEGQEGGGGQGRGDARRRTCGSGERPAMNRLPMFPRLPSIWKGPKEASAGALSVLFAMTICVVVCLGGRAWEEEGEEREPSVHAAHKSWRF